MTYEALANTIRTKFQTDIVIPASLTEVTFYDNQEAGRPEYPKDLWLRVNILNGEMRQASLGAARRFRTTGILEVQIFVPIGRGTKSSDEVIDAIVVSFRGVSENGVTYLSPSREPQGRPDSFYQINVTVPFWSDDIES